jgi:lysozyme family protein
MLQQDFQRWLGKAQKLTISTIPMTFATDRFPICLPYTLAEECPDPSNWSDPKNFSNDPDDPGGRTMCGITNGEYYDWLRKQNLPIVDVTKITQSQGYTIYHDSYWMPYCPNLLPGLDMEFFDESVNEGQDEAIKILQYVLGLQNDGIWGPKTKAAVAAIQNSQLVSLVQSVTARRRVVYEETNGYVYYHDDWEARASRIGVTALTRAKAA